MVAAADFESVKPGNAVFGNGRAVPVYDRGCHQRSAARVLLLVKSEGISAFDPVNVFACGILELLGYPNLSAVAVKPVVNGEQDVIGIMQNAGFVRSICVACIRAAVLTVKRGIICDLIICVAVGGIGGLVICCAADHGLVQRILCQLSVHEQRQIRPLVCPAIAAAQRLRILRSAERNAAAQQRYNDRFPPVLRCGTPILHGRDAREQMGLVANHDRRFGAGDGTARAVTGNCGDPAVFVNGKCNAGCAGITGREFFLQNI